MKNLSNNIIRGATFGVEFFRMMRRFGLLFPAVFILFAVCGNAAEQPASDAKTGATAVASQVVIERVKPSQVLYFYNEPAKAEIILKNQGAAAVAGELRVTEEWDLEETSPVWSGKVKMEAGETQTVAIAWAPKKVMYGRTLRAVFQPKDGPAVQGWEFFQVADPKDWFRTFMLNGASYAQMKDADTDPFITYNNFDNHFCYSPSGFACLAPDLDEWVNGQVGYSIKKKELREKIWQHQAIGIRAGAYTISDTAGPAGYELARKHPEWFLRDPKGAFNTVGTPVNPLELAQTLNQRCATWYCLYPDFGNPAVVQFAGEEVLRAMQMFNFDAMFFDCIYNIIGPYFNTPTENATAIFLWDGAPLGRGQDLEELSARCVAEVDRIVRAGRPQAVLWYNGATSKRNGWVKAHEAALRHPLSGSVFEVGGGVIQNPSFHMHAMRSYYEGLAAERDSYLKHKEFDDPVFVTGPMFNLDPLRYMTKAEFAATRDLWTTSNHIGAFYIATRFHPFTVGVTSFRPMAQFMTRYSALLWARDVKLLPRPEKTVNVDSNREVWWNECVYERETKKYRDLLIHVVNSPENENFDLKVAREPPAAKHVEVEVKLPAKTGKVRAWALQMSGFESSPQIPMQMELKPSIQDGKLLVELPEFKYHTLVVVRQWKGNP